MPALTPREGGAPLWYVSCVLLLLLLLLSSWRWRAFQLQLHVAGGAKKEKCRCEAIWTGSYLHLNFRLWRPGRERENRKYHINRPWGVPANRLFDTCRWS